MPSPSSRARATSPGGIGALVLGLALLLHPLPAHAKGSGVLSGLFKGLGKGLGKSRAGGGVARALARSGGRAARAVSRGGRGSKVASAAVRSVAGRGTASAATGAARVRVGPAAAHPIASERLQAIVHRRGIAVRATPLDLVVDPGDAMPRPLLSMRVGSESAPVQAQAVFFVRRPLTPVARAGSSATAVARAASRRRPKIKLPSRAGRARLCQLVSELDAAAGLLAGGDEGEELSSQEVDLASAPLDEPIADPQLDQQEEAAQGERATAARAVSLLDLTVEPQDAQLWLDGVHVPRPDPARVTVGLTGGSHVLELVRPGRRTLAVSLLAEPGRRYRLDLTLSPLPSVER